MRILQSLSKITSLFLTAFLLGFPIQAHAAPGGERVNSSRPSLSSCEDFAQRQIKLADRLLGQSNYTRALKVLNSTAENCDIEAVREKIVEVFGEWYPTVRNQGQSALKEYLNVLSSQSYIGSAQKQRLRGQVESYVQGLITQEYNGDNFRGAYQLCRSYSSFVDGNFEAKYYCGTSAEELGAEGVAMDSYQWLVQNWNGNQSLTTWNEIASTLENLYFLNGRFQSAYTLARKKARRDPSPEAVLSSLISARGRFLSPVLRAASIFYDNQPSQAALSHVDGQLQRVNFPKYVKAFYILNSDGNVERGMYGSEANQPSTTLLEKTKGTLSLLQSGEDSDIAWLVSPLNERHLVLEIGVATTPEENVRLERVYENIENDKQWKKLYDLEFTETSPSTGSAVGTLISSASLDGQDLDMYDEIVDASSLLAYYCIQDEDGNVEQSHRFERANLGYGDSEWERTSNTPALYHHSIDYSGQSVREVVWPTFIDEEWTGVVRIGLTHS